jgi:hypothetical protein
MSHLRHLMLLAAVCAALCGAAREAHACSCGPRPTVLEAFEQSDHVVVTKAIAIEKSEKAAPPGGMSDGENYVAGVKATRMRVERAYKGNLKVGDELTFGQGGGADCIWTFDEEAIGQQFLFYLIPLNKGQKVWYAVTCGRSSGLQHATDDLLYLNKLDKVRGRTRLSGTIRFAADGHPDVAGRLIRVVGAKGTYKVRTDANGVYEIYDLPPGRYTIEPDIPPGWKLDRYWLSYSRNSPPDAERDPLTKVPILLEAKKHTGLDIVFEIDNAVRGRIFDAEGRPMNGVCLDLIPADGSKGKYLADCTETGGMFEIDEIPPGRYVLVVNDDGEVSSNEPFGTFYYPNVLKREEATVFEIGLGNFIEDLQIYAPIAAEIVVVEGVLLFSDGKPVMDERVEFVAEKTGESEKADARAKTDARGRFSIKILKGSKGRLAGTMYTYVGKYENCPQLDKIIKQTGNSFLELKTPAFEITAETSLYGVELKYPFPGCKKAKIE